ncbi:hypothetical protein VFPPC_17827 [Pochonia chlamydosporia 170]|uniref:Uncharacterized protein n=1 Tax=Pochonia chlamydosporia 170 TaxID=1380566 RepID=A0A219AQB2_METCM|nr:hypothetical protein VFPPC_17827 [Pochonia chlamydosporia 170]OWT42980.1 hypothetical protein VFPPC_17827 [Pochonia chlamydosporia 170]
MANGAKADSQRGMENGEWGVVWLTILKVFNLCVDSDQPPCAQVDGRRAGSFVVKANGRMVPSSSIVLITCHTLLATPVNTSRRTCSSILNLVSFITFSRAVLADTAAKIFLFHSSVLYKP